MPIRLCIEARCPNEATYRGRCRECARGRERDTHPNKHIYASAKWKYTRRAQLHREPLCDVCGDIATDVDHIVPIEQGGSVWGAENLSSLCAVCHGRKTRKEQRV